jgi:hypothetical protein
MRSGLENLKKLPSGMNITLPAKCKGHVFKIKLNPFKNCSEQMTLKFFPGNQGIPLLQS